MSGDVLRNDIGRTLLVATLIARENAPRQVEAQVAAVGAPHWHAHCLNVLDVQNLDCVTSAVHYGFVEAWSVDATI
eukprot:9260507-Pyramimonas_sp.AAC.1